MPIATHTGRGGNTTTIRLAAYLIPVTLKPQRPSVNRTAFALARGHRAPASTPANKDHSPWTPAWAIFDLSLRDGLVGRGALPKLWADAWPLATAQGVGGVLVSLTGRSPDVARIVCLA